MDRAEVLANEVLDYIKDYYTYEVRDAYNSEEEAYEDFYDILVKRPKGVLTEIIEDINMTLQGGDLNDDETNKHFHKSVELAIKLNKYANDFEKEKQSEIE